MASFEIGFYWGEKDGAPLVAMVPMTEEACDVFVERFSMPAECDGIDVTPFDPITCIEMLPKKFLFGNTKKEPTNLHRYLFYET